MALVYLPDVPAGKADRICDNRLLCKFGTGASKTRPLPLITLTRPSPDAMELRIPFAAF